MEKTIRSGHFAICISDIAEWLDQDAETQKWLVDGPAKYGISVFRKIIISGVRRWVITRVISDFALTTAGCHKSINR
jgi:hypothetical protein